MTVKLNGEKLAAYNNSKYNQMDSVHNVYKEQSATIEKADEKGERFASKKEKNSQKKIPVNHLRLKNVKTAKPIIIAVMTAIFIGSVLGFVLLGVFGNIDSVIMPNHNNRVVQLNPAEQADQDGEKDALSLSSVNAYVLQAGVFSDEANAQTLVGEYKAQGIIPVVWQRDNQYYVLTAVTNSQENADALAKQQEAMGLEAFVKEWESSAGEMNMTSGEAEWFQTFHELLAGSIEAVSASDSVPLEGWTALLGNQDHESERVASFAEEIEPYLEHLAGSEQVTFQQGLLEIWHHYDMFLRNEE